MCKYSVSVNGSEFTEINSESLNTLDVITTANNDYHLLLNNKSFTAQITANHFYKKTYEVTVNNTAYTVVIENDLDRLIKQMGFEQSSNKQINKIKAPMPGLILDISVSVGQQVNEGDNLLILEAMKMENSITAPRDGVIKSLAIAINDTVDKNQLLLEFE